MGKSSGAAVVRNKDHFINVDSWKAASPLIAFVPKVLPEPRDHPLRSLAIYVRDHKKRELPIADRILEAYFRGFSFCQSTHEPEEARRRALQVKYGQDPKLTGIGGHEGRMYELGAEVPADDIDGRNAAVITWADEGMFFLVASSELDLAALLPIARSLYPRQTR